MAEISATGAQASLKNAPGGPAARLLFLDNAKAALVVLVVAHHAGQPYGPTGGAWPLTHAEHWRMLGPFFHVNASFFMGLFFFLSAFFLPGAYDRKGPRRFLMDRLIRFGSVLLLFQFLVIPVLTWAFSKEGLSFGRFWFREIFERQHIEFAHLWFIAHLLVYAVGYVLWRRLRGTPPAAQTPRPFPSNLAIAGYALALSVVSALVRIWFPIDRWVFIGVPCELAHLPQYFSLFVLGALAYRYAWLPGIPARAGRLWLGIGLALALFRYSYTAFRWGFLRNPHRGFEWQPFFWTTWEALLCVGMCIGTIWFFREYVGGVSRVSRFFTRNAYGLYIVHLPIVIMVQFALEGSGFGPIALTALSTAVTTLLGCAVVAGLRTLPGAGKVL